MQKIHQIVLGSRYPWYANGLGLFIALGLPFINACRSSTLETSTTQPANTAAVEQDDSALASQVGKSFYFHAEFQDQFSDALFIVREDENRGWGDVLVLNQADRSFQVPSDVETPLWIYGDVERLTQVELADNEVPETDWPTYDGQPYVVAKRITLVPSPDELVSEADAFIDQHVTVYGKVEPVEAANTFILQDPSLFGGKGIILIQGANADLSEVVDNDKAVVSGVLRPYVLADLKQDYDLPWDLDLQERLEADFEESPVLIVDQALAADN